MAATPRSNAASGPATARIESRAAAAALAVGILLTIAKVAAWRLTGSTAVLSDALEGLVNVVASFVTLWAIHHSHRPADRTHPYGHGRFELLSSSLEGGMMATAALVIIWHAADTLVHGTEALASLDAGIALVLGTMVVNGAVGAWLLLLGRRHGSPALDADGKHLLSDSATSAGVVAALVVVHATGWHWVDPVAAIAISIAVGVIGLRVVRRSLGDLVDEQDPRDAQRVEALLESHRGAPGREPRICSWHKLRVRHIGREHWVEFHMCVPEAVSVRTGHEAASAIEHEIETMLGPGNATAHVEPCEDPACERCRQERAPR